MTTFEIKINMPKSEFDLIMSGDRPPLSQLNIRKMIINVSPCDIPALKDIYVTVLLSIPWGDSFTIANSISDLFNGALLTGWLQGSRDAHKSYSELRERKIAGI